MQNTLLEHLRHAAGDKPNRAAIIAGTRDAALSYAQLIAFSQSAQHVIESLPPLSIGIGVFASDPLEQAMALFGLAANCAVLPLNPNMGRIEMERLSETCPLDLLICPARDASALSNLSGAEGDALSIEGHAFYLIPLNTGRPTARPISPSQSDADALIMATSGTTAAPKIVVHTQAALLNASAAVAETFKLGPEDCIVNPMPLFHIHGLSVCLFSTLLSGGRIVLSAPRDPTSFLQICVDHGATWYSAVPTFHHAVACLAEQEPEVAARCRFRFIRSASSTLPARTRDRLAGIFNAPVLEGYGMTEACGFITQQAPGDVLIHGSLGTGKGVDVLALDASGAEVARGTLGELALRGPRVIPSYRVSSGGPYFVNDCLLTGDIGTVDTGGEVRIFGRSKEVIKRGGHTVSPYTVEDALLSIKGVAEAAAFPVDHPTLGQDLMAAVTLNVGVTLQDQDIRQAVRSLSADYLVPSRVIILDALPKTASGKLKRSTLAALLPQPDRAPATAPENDVELMVLLIAQDIFDAPSFRKTADFFYSGGDSLTGLRLAAEVSDLFDMPCSLETLFQFPTPASLAHHILAERGQAAMDAVAELRAMDLEDDTKG